MFLLRSPRASPIDNLSQEAFIETSAMSTYSVEARCVDPTLSVFPCSSVSNVYNTNMINWVNLHKYLSAAQALTINKRRTNGRREMISFELGKEIKNMFSRLVTSVGQRKRNRTSFEEISSARNPKIWVPNWDSEFFLCTMLVKRWIFWRYGIF